jgi:small subunit ribosomal protein S16
MVKIRLMRVGKRKQPSYRVVVADARSPRDGRIIEAIGNYQPRQEPSGVTIDNDRALYWLEQGAQPSNTVRNLLRITGAWSAFTGEAPPAGAQPATGQTAATPKPTPAASIKATPAASVTDERNAPGADGAADSTLGGANALPDAATEEALLDDQPDGASDETPS